VLAGALVALALLASAATYNFFRWQHAHGIHAHEFFHYYLGAKYFPELGYAALYECALVAVTEGRPDAASRAYEIRDLRSIERRQRIVPARVAPDCHARFEPARWAAFRRDTRFFAGLLPPERFARVLTDQGLNASPVWLAMGHPIAEWTPVHLESLRRLARLDLAVMIAGFAAVAWAFGPVGLALAMLAWAANPLARYEWVGDAPLRHLWLGSLLVGLALLRRARPGAAGVLLAASALLRLFPVLFALGPAARAARTAVTERRLEPGFLRYAASGTAAGLLMLAVAIAANGRGAAVVPEFAGEMASYATLKARNSMGLRALLTFTPDPPPPRLVDGRLVHVEADRMAQNRRVFAARRPLYWAMVAAFAWLFWRALREAEDWEAACLGFVLVFVLTQPASYYASCIVGAALLGTRRTPIALATLAALVAWGTIALVVGETPGAYAAASGVALLLSGFTLWAMRRPPDDVPAGAPAAPAPG